MSVTVIQRLSRYRVLEADNLFSSSQGERNCAPEWITPRVSLIPDLDGEDGKICNSGADEILRLWIDAVME